MVNFLQRDVSMATCTFLDRTEARGRNYSTLNIILVLYDTLFWLIIVSYLFS
mgnify:CR=1 FL=1